MYSSNLPLRFLLIFSDRRGLPLLPVDILWRSVRTRRT